mgnify:CR=1 FL=1
MPYESEMGSVRIQLNITYVKEMLEDFEKRKVDKEFDLYNYVLDLEDELYNDFDSGFNYYSLEDWFEKRYNETDYFNDIEWEEVEFPEEEPLGEFDFMANPGTGIVRCKTKEEKEEAIKNISEMMDCYGG